MRWLNTPLTFGVPLLGSTTSTNVIDAETVIMLSVDVQVTGTVAGTLNLQVSNNPLAIVTPGAVTWNTIATQAVSNTTSFFSNQGQAAGRYYRIQYTSTSGAATTVTAYFNSKGF
jgi:hypothetical protein